MREIMTGRDIGATIDFRSLGTYEARHPWPEETTVSAGRGVVFTRSVSTGERSSYSTPFIEVYPPDASFIRGEGETPAACEDAAWAKYQLALSCSDNSGTHEWEPRGYLNGAGFCSRCSTFGSQVFTGEQLGQFCRECGTGTTYHTEKDGDETVWLCKEHTPAASNDLLFGDGEPYTDEDFASDMDELLSVLRLREERRKAERKQWPHIKLHRARSAVSGNASTAGPAPPGAAGTSRTNTTAGPAKASTAGCLPSITGRTSTNSMPRTSNRRAPAITRSTTNRQEGEP